MKKKKKAYLIINLSIIVLGLIFTVWFFSRFAAQIAPFIVAGIIAYLISPGVSLLEHRGLRRGAAVAVMVTGIIALFGLLVFLFVPGMLTSFANAAETLPSVVSHFNDSYKSFENELAAAGININQYLDLRKVAAHLGESLQAMLMSASDNLVNFSGEAINLVIVPIVTVLLLLNVSKIEKQMLYVFPSDTRLTFQKMFYDIDRVIGGFLRGQLIVSAVAGILTGLGAFVLGIPYATAIGVITAVTSMVPYFGPFVGLAVVIVLSVLSGIKAVIFIIIWFGAVQVVCGNILAPAVMADHVGLHPITIIFSIMIFGALWGGLGMLLAVPLVGTLKVIAAYLIRAAARPEIETATSVYTNYFKDDFAKQARIAYNELSSSNDKQ